MKNIYTAIHDVSKDILVDVDLSHLDFLNRNGYGIFKTVNRFNGKRSEDNIASLDYFYVDLDNGTKKEQVDLIEKCPTPSKIIESKNGFHVYWKIRDDMVKKFGKEKAIEYYKFIQQLIVNCTNGDQSAKDVPRLLRLEGFNHLKDPSEPFKVNEVFSSSFLYKPENILNWFSVGYRENDNKPMKDDFVKSKAMNVFGNEYISIWDFIGEKNQGELLQKLSGHNLVNNEVYTFSKNRNKYFIHVNGKKITGAWIDEKGMIGSHNNGGPTIIQWLEYFGHSKITIAKELENIFR